MDLINLLRPKERELISAIGGGGKTTILKALAEQLAKEGEKVLFSTTTKISVPEDVEKHEIIIGSELEVRRRLEKIRTNKIVVAGSRVMENHKIVGFPKEFFDDLYRLKKANFVLVEADGSKRKPVKFNADYEPVVPDAATKVLGVIGLDCMGKPLVSEICHRAEEFCNKTGYKIGEVINEKMIVDLIEREDGLFKGVPKNSEKILVLNKADDALRREWVFKIVEEINNRCRNKLSKIVATSFKEKTMIVL